MISNTISEMDEDITETTPTRYFMVLVLVVELRLVIGLRNGSTRSALLI